MSLTVKDVVSITDRSAKIRRQFFLTELFPEISRFLLNTGIVNTVNTTAFIQFRIILHLFLLKIFMKSIYLTELTTSR